MTNIYQNIYDLINQYIYGNSIVDGSPEELVAVILSTIMCVCVIWLPFWFIFRILGKVFS